MKKLLGLAVALPVLVANAAASGSGPAHRLVRVGVDGSGRGVVLATSDYRVEDLSPSRTQLLASRAGVLEVRNLDGSDPHTVATMPNAIDSATWAPVTRRIAFSTADLSRCDPGATKCAIIQVWLVRSNGSDLHELGDNTIHPAWSPAGQRLAFVGRYVTAAQIGRLALANADGRKIQLLRSRGEIAGIAWSPRGDRVAFATSYPVAIRVVRLRTTSRAKTIATADHFAWSPDGRRLAVTHVEPNRGSHPRTDLRIVDAQTGHAVTVAGAPSIPLVAWSPNARWIAYTRGGPFGNDLALVSPDGRRRRVIASEATRAEIARVYWLRGGRGLVYDVYDNA